jgi:hypothetical protein
MLSYLHLNSKSPSQDCGCTVQHKISEGAWLMNLAVGASCFVSSVAWGCLQGEWWFGPWNEKTTPIKLPSAGKFFTTHLCVFLSIIEPPSFVRFLLSFPSPTIFFVYLRLFPCFSFSLHSFPDSHIIQSSFLLWHFSMLPLRPYRLSSISYPLLNIPSSKNTPPPQCRMLTCCVSNEVNLRCQFTFIYVFFLIFVVLYHTWITCDTASAVAL